MKITTILMMLTALILAHGLVGPAAGAVEGPKTSAIFVKFDGIPGGSTDEQHKQEVEALSFNWSAKVKEGKSDSPAAAEANDALILKPIDIATPKLMAALAAGKTIPQVVISVKGTAAGAKNQAVYLVYTFTDVRLTAVSHTIGNSAQEQVQFKYGKVQVKWQGAESSEEAWDVKKK